MRPDQQHKLDALTENLMDVFLHEADPENWNGAGESAAAMTPEVRGARNWDAKNANQVGSLVARALDLRDRINGAGFIPPPSQDDADADIARFEKQARRLLEAVGAKRGLA